MMQPIVKQVVLEHTEVCRREAEMHLQPVEEPHVGAGPGRTCEPVERRAGFLVVLVTPQGTHFRAVPERLTPGMAAHTGAACEEP